MKRTIGALLIITAFLLTVCPPLLAQDTTITEKDLKNTIHYNVTNPFIFGSGSIIFGYERILNKYRSFSINIGQATFPTLSIVSEDSVREKRLRGQGGFHLSADYRFYLAKHNIHTAPRGIYIGPYYSYNYFKHDHSWDVKSTAGGTFPVDSKTSMKVHTVGFELGYQFVFWRRFSVDMVLAGPGLAAYNLKAELGTNLSPADKEKFFEKLNDALADRFPGYGVIIDEGEFRTTGSTNTTDFGFRYMVQLGYRF